VVARQLLDLQARVDRVAQELVSGDEA
jgi:hypothetical protein